MIVLIHDRAGNKNDGRELAMRRSVVEASVGGSARCIGVDEFVGPAQGLRRRRGPLGVLGWQTPTAGHLVACGAEALSFDAVLTHLRQAV